ncbi:MAG: site-specific integrase [ANME-2 cluster archaeon]|nr:site-specific integrase [ANME-2 cluster archaeon]
MDAEFSNEEEVMIGEWFDAIKAKPTTIRIYLIAIRHYLKFHKMSLSELVQEADDDIKNGVLGRNRQIKHRFLSFKKSLEDKSGNTIHGYMSAVRSFYASLQIEYPKPRKYQKIPILEENKYLGIDKSEIKRILSYTNVRDKAITLFIISSGTAINELINITKDDFYNGLNRETGICTFHLRRKKTGGDYHTYCTPEASAAIQEYLNTRNDDLPWLFVGQVNKTREIIKMSSNGVGNIFRRLSVKTGHAGKFGYFNKIRAHNFRKYFKTTLTEEGCPRWAVEHMMGHKEEMDDLYSNPSGVKMCNTYYIPYVNFLLIDTAEVIIQTEEDRGAVRELQAEIKAMQEKDKQREKELENTRNAFLKLIEEKIEEKYEREAEEIRQSIMDETRKKYTKTVEEIEEDIKNIPDDIENSTDPKYIEGKKLAQEYRKKYCG